MNQSDGIIKDKHNRLIVSLLIFFVSLILTLAGLRTGVLTYTLATVRCLHAPVTAFGDDYSLPGEVGSGPSPLSTYYCSENDAISAGLHPSVLTPEGKAQADAQALAEKEKTTFSPDKITFTLYVPTLNGYSAGQFRIQNMQGLASQIDNQVFFPVKLNGSNVVQVREGQIPDRYELCKDAQYICTETGTDSKGESIEKQQSESKTPIYSYSINRGTTFINLEDVPSDFTDANALTIFESLTEYKQ